MPQGHLTNLETSKAEIVNYAIHYSMYILIEGLIRRTNSTRFVNRSRYAYLPLHPRRPSHLLGQFRSLAPELEQKENKGVRADAKEPVSG